MFLHLSVGVLTPPKVVYAFECFGHLGGFVKEMFVDYIVRLLGLSPNL